MEAIARAGHVYRIDGDLSTLQKLQGSFTASLIGIKKASTFTGFCNKHDNHLFKKLDESEFRPDSELAFLLGYRALCRELHAKSGASNFASDQLGFDRGFPVEDQVPFQTILRGLKDTTDVGLQELEQSKQEYDSILLAQNWDAVRFLSIEFAKVPEVACSGGTCPLFDFQGNPVQDISDFNRRLEGLYLSLFASGEKGFAVFTWLRSEPAGHSLIRSLLHLDRSRIPNAIVQFVFSSFENTFMAPIWWDALPVDVRTKLIQRLFDTADLLQDFDPLAIVDDGGNYVDWQAQSFTTNDSILRTCLP